MRSDDEQVNEIEELREEAERLTQLAEEHRRDALTEAGRAIASENRLAAASYWVEQWRNEENHQDSGDWYMSKVDRALAAQPAAPAREQVVERGMAALSRTTIWTPRNEAATRCELGKAFDAGRRMLCELRAPMNEERIDAFLAAQPAAREAAK